MNLQNPSKFTGFFWIFSYIIETLLSQAVALLLTMNGRKTSSSLRVFEAASLNLFLNSPQSNLRIEISLTGST